MATLSQHSIHHIHHSAAASGGGGGIPHGLGLLTTVASLPPKYRSRYLNIKTKSEIPLDLSVKQLSPQIANDVPIATSFTEVYTEPSDPHDVLETKTTTVQDVAAKSNIDVATMPTTTTAIIVVAAVTNTNSIVEPTPHPTPTPPLTPTKRKYLEHCGVETSTTTIAAATTTTTDAAALEEHYIAAALVSADAHANPTKLSKTDVHLTTKREVTPTKPIRSTDTAPKTVKAQPPAAKPAKNKATRKLKFDEETSSPVSGTIIRPLEDITDGSVQYSNGDIDPKYNIVEITEETKAELAAIRNVIGDYICKLCRIKFDDAFGLARHRCACIVLLEYRCPECGKQFNCPANLASHRRWHKPKKEGGGGAQQKKENRNTMNTMAKPKASSTTTTTTTAPIVPVKNPKTFPEKLTEDLSFACSECGKKFKRQAYLRKHQLTHVAGNVKTATHVPPQQQSSSAVATVGISSRLMTTNTLTSHVIGSTASSSTASSTYHSYANSIASSSYSNSSNSHSRSSASSLNSYNGAHEDEGGVLYSVAAGAAAGIASGSGDYDFGDADSLSDDECTNSSTGYGRLQIVESGLTEEENIAAAALTNLRNCASVIQHTTLAH